MDQVDVAMSVIPKGFFLHVGSEFRFGLYDVLKFTNAPSVGNLSEEII